MTNDAWLLWISSIPDPSCCICHLDRNRSIKTLLYPTLLTASFYCQVKNDWFPQPAALSECVKMDRRTIRAQDFPTIVFPCLTGSVVSGLTLQQTWPSACWHDLPQRPVPARWTVVDAEPRSIASLRAETTSDRGLLNLMSCKFIGATGHNDKSLLSQKDGLPAEKVFLVICRWSVKHLLMGLSLWRALSGERLIATFLTNTHLGV